MKLIVTHSIDPDTAEAAAELIADARQQLGGVQPAAGILYVAMDIDHTMLVEQLTAAFPGIALIGCSTDGEVSSAAGFHEDSTVLILFASKAVTIRAGLGRSVGADPAAAVRQAIDMARQPHDPPIRLCIALPDGLTVSGTAITEALQEALGPEAILVGGTAADQFRMQSCRLLFNDEVLNDAVPLLLLSGPLEVGVGIDSGWSPVGELVEVTQSTGNLVARIGEHTAVEFYRQRFGEHVIPDAEYPLALHDPANNTSCLRAPLVLHDDGSVMFAGDIPQGSLVRITDSTRADILQACANSVRAAFTDLATPSPDGALVFSCAARRLVLGSQTAEELRTLQGASPAPLPIAGFYTYGEIAAPCHGEPAQFHNETFVTVLLAEV